MALKEAGLRASVRSVSTVVPAFFDVAITNTNSPINEGDVLVVDYSVDNTGDSFETQDIRLEIDSVQEDADLDVSLSGGASDTGTLEWDTTGQGADTYEATVLSDDDSDTVTVEIPDAFFDVAIQSTNSPVEEGETLNVDYFVDNTGGVEDTQDIRLEIDNTQEDVDTGVTLDSGTSTTGTLQWDTTNESADTYSATVLSDDDSDSVTVEIEGVEIPDSAIYQFDARQLTASDGSSVTEWECSVTGEAVSGIGTYIEDGINGRAAIELDGIDDGYLNSDFDDLEEVTVFFVVELNNTSSQQYLTGRINSSPVGHFFQWDDGWRMAVNSDSKDRVNEPGLQLITAHWESGNRQFRGDGDVKDSGSESMSEPLDSVSIGYEVENDRRYFEGLIGLVEYHENISISEVEEREDEIASEWGISL